MPLKLAKIVASYSRNCPRARSVFLIRDFSLNTVYRLLWSHLCSSFTLRDKHWCVLPAPQCLSASGLEYSTVAITCGLGLIHSKGPSKSFSTFPLKIHSFIQLLQPSKKSVHVFSPLAVSWQLCTLPR